MKNNYPDNEEFFSVGLYIDSRVLTPRNETEIMIYEILKEIKNDDNIVIDIGTGSGCIPIAVLKNKKNNISAFGFDISKDALEVAKININKHNFGEKIVLFESNLLQVIFEKKSYFTKIFKGKKLIFTANLPYIKNGDFKNMDKEVLVNDPHIALFGGEKTGFELYEKLIKQILKLKNIFQNEVVLFIEIGFDQAEYSKKYLQKKFIKFEYFKDYNGIERIIKIHFSS